MNPSKFTHCDSEHIPVAMYLAIMLAALVLGANAVYVNREYAFANLALLGLDAAALAVRKSSIDLLLLADIALFFVAALMPRARFRALRGKLLVLGLLIWAFDCAHTYQARASIVVAGQSSTAASTQRVADLRASIDSLRATAGSLRQSAARQSTSLIASSRAASLRPISAPRLCQKNWPAHCAPRPRPRPTSGANGCPGKPLPRAC